MIVRSIFQCINVHDDGINEQFPERLDPDSRLIIRLQKKTQFVYIPIDPTFQIQVDARDMRNLPPKRQQMFKLTQI